MLTIIFAIIALVCGIGWLCYWVGCAALIMYIQGKDYALPTEEELKACMSEVVKKLFKIKDSGGRSLLGR